MRRSAAVVLVLALCAAPLLQAGASERQPVLDAYKKGKVLTGRFTLAFYEGEPSFTGSVEAGPVEER